MNEMLKKAIETLTNEEEFAYNHVLELKEDGKEFWRMSCNYRNKLDGMCQMILYLFDEDAFNQANQIKYTFMEKVHKLL